MHTPPSALAEARVALSGGATLRLGDTWADRPALIVFLRHLGCLSCSVQLADLLPRLPEVDAHGVRTVLVGCSGAERLDDFVRRFGLAAHAVTVATDPHATAHHAAGLLDSRWATWGPRGWRDYAWGLANGHTNPGLWGPSGQQGGALLVDTDGTVAFAHHNQGVADIALATDLVGAVLALVLTRKPR